MRHRVDLDFIGLGGASKAYGGHLHAWSFREIDGRVWFEEFRQKALASIGNHYLPIYRMADGEYRFLFGRRINWARKPILRELLAVGAEKVRIKNPDKWQTSWGEVYDPSETRALREKLRRDVGDVSQRGYLACYINDNGLNAFVEYNDVLLKLMQRSGIELNEYNYVPFHFAPSLLINDGWQDFVRDRHLLIVTGLNQHKEDAIRATLKNCGAATVSMLPISANASLSDSLDLSQVDENIEIALVAAGIGSANILKQLEPLRTLCIDIGGLMNCYVDPDRSQHGGVIGLPKL